MEKKKNKQNLQYSKFRFTTCCFKKEKFGMKILKTRRFFAKKIPQTRVSFCPGLIRVARVKE